jgi:hypothetical protein
MRERGEGGRERGAGREKARGRAEKGEGGRERGRWRDGVE